MADGYYPQAGMSETGKVKCLTWNCRGMGNLKKIKQVMNRIKQSQAKAVFLQETLMMTENTVKIKRRFSPHTG